MRCQQVCDHGERYIDGDIAASIRAEIDAHLGTCKTCRAEYQNIKEIKAVFADTALPAAPEEIVDTWITTVYSRGAGTKRTTEKKWFIPDWWILAAPGVRVVYALVLIVLTAGGIFMGRDLWELGVPANVATGSDNIYPGITTFETMQPGSVEQTYFELTSYRAGR
jgi:anti-sigma factor RsiW